MEGRAGAAPAGCLPPRGSPAASPEGARGPLRTFSRAWPSSAGRLADTAACRACARTCSPARACTSMYTHAGPLRRHLQDGEPRGDGERHGLLRHRPGGPGAVPGERRAGQPPGRERRRRQRRPGDPHHAAQHQGLEFDRVIITGLEEGIFPHDSSSGTAEDLEEERRIFYVGITRARERLRHDVVPEPEDFRPHHGDGSLPLPRRDPRGVRCLPRGGGGGGRRRIGYPRGGRGLPRGVRPRRGGAKMV